jgi:hypothetical protein
LQVKEESNEAERKARRTHFAPRSIGVYMEPAAMKPG